MLSSPSLHFGERNVGNGLRKMGFTVKSFEETCDKCSKPISIRIELHDGTAILFLNLSNLGVYRREMTADTHTKTCVQIRPLCV